MDDVIRSSSIRTPLAIVSAYVPEGVVRFTIARFWLLAVGAFWFLPAGGFD